MKTLKAVTFDLWQTLILDTPEGLRRARAERLLRIQEVLSRQGLLVGAAALDHAYEAVGQRLENLWTSQRDVGSRGQVRWLLEALGLGEQVSGEGAPMDALDEAYCVPILSAMPVRNVGALEVVTGLRARGLRLALICNTGRTPGKMLRLVLDPLGLAPYLGALNFSDEVGLRKPHPEIFLRTVSALGVAPADAVHVGDDVTSDVAGARGVGMRAIHLCHAASASQPSDGVEAIPSLAALTDLLFPPES